MKYTTIIIAGCLLAPVHALAGEPLTVGRCLDVYNGLLALDHYDRVVGDKVVATQYKLGGLRFLIGQNMSALQHVRDAAERARTGLLSEAVAANGGSPLQPGSAEFMKLTAAYQAVLDKPCDVTPGRIKLQDLKVGDGPDENAFPPSVLAALAPIIDEK